MKPYIRTKKHRELMSEATKGISKSEDAKRNMSESAKERFKDKTKHPFYGRKHSKKTKAKLRLTWLGKKNPKLSKALKGKHHSPETEFKKGHDLWKLRKKNYKLENNPNWRGGIARLPYPHHFSEELKESIRKRDNFICQECNVLQGELKRKLDIHHIDYNKKNNSIWNLISLCNNCHTKTNFNRKHWKKYFQNIMALREIFNPDNILVFNENKQLISMEKIK